MVEIPENAVAMFSAVPQETTDDSVTIEIPKSEITQGSISPMSTYRICVLEAEASEDSSRSQGETTAGGSSKTGRTPQPGAVQHMVDQRRQGPPVSEGQRLKLTIETIGEQGDGIARHDGFVIIVPGAGVGQTIEAEVYELNETHAFAEIVSELKTPE